MAGACVRGNNAWVALKLTYDKDQVSCVKLPDGLRRGIKSWMYEMSVGNRQPSRRIAGDNDARAVTCTAVVVPRLPWLTSKWKKAVIDTHYTLGVPRHLISIGATDK